MCKLTLWNLVDLIIVYGGKLSKVEVSYKVNIFQK